MLACFASVTTQTTEAMHNPFADIETRLSRIEAQQQETLQCLRQAIAQPAPQVGGVELAQEVTHLSKSRIYVLVSERAIPHAKRGNRLYFNRAELLEWVAAGNRAAA
jgi:predicted DNA-binding transcriptional regulator AlpA